MVFCLLLVSSTACARAAEDSNSMFLLGPGLVVSTKPYRGISPSVLPIPMVKFVSGRFYISGAAAGYRLLAHDGFSLDIIGKTRFDGYDADDSGRLNGMHNRNGTIDAGCELTLTGEWGTVWTSAVTDTLGQHDGQEIKLGYAKPFVCERLTVSPSTGLIWKSNNLANYYYGIRADEACAGRPVYHIGDSTNLFVGLRVQYHPDERWTLMAGATYQFLDSKIRKSPIVDNSFVISFLAGTMYKF